MTSRILFVAICALAPAFGASKEIVELQRDVALLQEQVRGLQRSQDEKLGALTAILNQTLDAAQKTATAVAVLDSQMRDRMRDQEKTVSAPVAGLSSKVDSMANEFAALKETIADLSGRMSKLQQQLVDINTAVRTMQAPAPPPPGAAGGGAPQVPASTLYENARRDYLGGKADLAMQGFQDYLKFYGDTDMAPNAQYYIGEIYYSQGDFERAVQEFDTVLEKYPDNVKTADAMFMKGQALVKQGKRTAGAQEFREVVKRFPRTDAATKAAGLLKGLGLSAGAPSRKR